MSDDMARTSLRRFSASLVLSDWTSRRLSLVTPSTRRAIFSPNMPAISSRVASVSSIVSCSRPVTIDEASSFISARMPATSTGWEKYGSPEARSCVPCFFRP